MTRRLAVLLSCALLGAHWTAMPGEPAHAASEQETLRTAMLAAHNQERATLGLSPLEWSDALATEAASNAKVLAAARDPILAHLQMNNGKPRGENLWLGTRGAFTFADMAEGWLEERSLYVNGVMPNISSSGNWADVGHYSQMIWRTTTRIGCAVASSAEMDILVCRYDPPGNIYGRNAISGERR